MIPKPKYNAEKDEYRFVSRFSYPAGKHPYGINRDKYKGRGRPREEDYNAGIVGVIGTAI